MSGALCLDSSVLVKLLVDEPGSGQAADLVATGAELVAPAFAWAEVGSVLRKKMRSGGLTLAQGDRAWEDFLQLDVAFVQDGAVAQRSWAIAARFGLPTLYDAAFLAVAETTPGGCELWTADVVLVDRLGGRHPLVHSLFERPPRTPAPAA